MSWYPSQPNLSCIKHNEAGFPFENLPCLYSETIGKTYHSFEIDYDPVFVRDKMINNAWIPLVAITLYAIGIVGGKAYFANRPAWNWRKGMAMWNLGLSIFSGIGFLRTFPQLVHNLIHYTATENLCHDPESQYGSGATGLWVQMFILSKIPELLDTLFIVVHKKPLIFLHWYHHISVLLYCWHAYTTKAPSGIFFATMNYAVHAIMYFYYYLMAVKRKPKWFNSIWITVAQISQMILGVIVTIMGFVLAPKYEKECALKRENNLAALIMYGSYFLLFLQFFLQRYFKTTPTKGISSSKKKS